MTGAAEHVTDLVANEVFDLVASRSEVFSGVKFFRVFGEGLADGGGHGEAEIGIDVDLGATDAPGDFDIGFGDTCGVGAHFAAVFVDLFDEILGDA